MGQVACVGPFQHGYTGIVANFPIQLAIAHVNGIHVPGAVLQKHVREPAGSRANIHGYRISHIRAKHAQRFIQLERPHGPQRGAHGRVPSVLRPPPPFQRA